jgi:hypothetical protein
LKYRNHPPRGYKKYTQEKGEKAMDYLYYVIEEKEIETGRTMAYANKVSCLYNLKDYFHPHKGCEILSINVVKTLKKAKEIAECWNESAKEKGNHIF